MRLKSYLKGLGLGIFITSLILSIGLNNTKSEISNDEIRKRAAELGMVSADSLLLKEAKNMADNAQSTAMESEKSDQAKTLQASANTANVETEKKETAVSADNVAPNGEILPEKTEEKILPKEDSAATAGQKTEDSSDTEQTEKTTDNAADIQQPVSDSSEIIDITVNSGESSISVANKMAGAGLISDARQFDSYLVLNGYDRRLVPGTHSIPKNASASEMGEILTSHP